MAEDQFSDLHNINEGSDDLEIRVFQQKTNPYHINSYIVGALVNGRKVKGTLYANKDMPVLEPGKSYQVSDMTWVPIAANNNPYTFDYLSYAKVHGLSHRFKFPKSVVIEEKKITDPIRYGAYQIRRDLSERYLCVLGIEKGSLVNGLLFGLKSEIPACIADLFRQLGVSHLLAVSGLHVGLIMLIVYQILLTLSVPRIPRAVCIAVFLIFYCYLTGGSPSVIRSSLMSVMLMFAPVFSRKYNALNAVAASAVILLLVNPFSLMDLGFQFSYSAVLGILIAYPKIKPWFGKKKRSALTSYIIDMLAVSLSAALFTSPVAIYYFNSLQLGSMLLNLLVIPLTFCVMICAILCLPGLFIHSVFADLVLYALDLSLGVFRTVLRLASRSGIWTVHVSSYWKPLFFALIIIALIMICVQRKRNKMIGCFASIILCVFWFYQSTRPEFVHPELKKGDLLLFRAGRQALIINTGWRYFNYNDVERAIIPVLEQWGTKDVTLIIGDRTQANSFNIGMIRRHFPDCKIYVSLYDDGIETNHSDIRSDTTLFFSGNGIHVIPENKMLFTEFKIKNNHFLYDNDSLYINGKGMKEKRIGSLSHKRYRRE